MKPESEKGGSATAILRGKGEKTTAQTGRWKVSSYYLADVGAAPPQSPYTHNHEAVDLSHARWATVDAVTAIDLCAAALGRMHRGYPGRAREMDLGIARKDGALLALRNPAAWIQAVDANPEYRTVWGLRGALVHRTARRRIDVTVSRSLTLTGVGGGTRTSRARLHVSDPGRHPRRTACAALPRSGAATRCRVSRRARDPLMLRCRTRRAAEIRRGRPAGWS